METITGKTKEELAKMLAKEQEDLRVIRFGASGAKAKNVKATLGLRKSIARIMTELNKK